MRRKDRFNKILENKLSVKQLFQSDDDLTKCRATYTEVKFKQQFL